MLISSLLLARSASKSSNGIFSPHLFINPFSYGVFTLDEDSNRIQDDRDRYQGKSHLRDMSLQLIYNPFVHDLFVFLCFAHTPCQLSGARPGR